VAAERVQAATAGGIPDPRRPIEACGDHELPVRAEHGTLNVLGVAAETTPRRGNILVQVVVERRSSVPRATQCELYALLTASSPCATETEPSIPTTIMARV
jgi:hypothetical protein